VVLLAITAGALHAQDRPALPPLEFLGFRAGAELWEVAELTQALSGKRLHCERSRHDHEVSECRAEVRDPEGGGALYLWLSAIDSVSAVLTVSGPVSEAQLSSWRDSLQVRFGPVSATVQGTQSMMQWVRHGTMLRLTWRTEKSGRVASVSLVDGPVLDAWGRKRDSTLAGQDSMPRRDSSPP
jgi:hypothetical protein